MNGKHEAYELKSIEFVSAHTIKADVIVGNGWWVPVDLDCSEAERSLDDLTIGEVRELVFEKTSKMDLSSGPIDVAEEDLEELEEYT